MRSLVMPHKQQDRKTKVEIIQTLATLRVEELAYQLRITELDPLYFSYLDKIMYVDYYIIVML